MQGTQQQQQRVRHVETINRPDLTLAQFLEENGSQTAI
jgi:hypothetical protein